MSSLFGLVSARVDPSQDLPSAPFPAQVLYAPTIHQISHDLTYSLGRLSRGPTVHRPTNTLHVHMYCTLH